MDRRWHTISSTHIQKYDKLILLSSLGLFPRQARKGGD